MNVSEGDDQQVIAALAAAAGDDLLDVHSDPHHHRSVFTMIGEDAPRAVARLAVECIDLRRHRGAHPRLGVVDVVPFVPLDGAALPDALRARDAFARWAADELAVPCFLYGPERMLPDIRRQAWFEMFPEVVPPGPARTTAGATCVGARPVLIAYNVVLGRGVTMDEAYKIAAAIRRPGLRTLAIPVGSRIQISMNLTDPATVGPAAAYDAVAARAPVATAELVGLMPAAVLDTIDPERWQQLDLAVDRTIEARLITRGVRRAAT